MQRLYRAKRRKSKAHTELPVDSVDLDCFTSSAALWDENADAARAHAHLARRLVIQARMDERYMVSIRVDLDCFTSGFDERGEFEQSAAVSDENADAANTPTHCARCMRTGMDEKPLSSHAVLLGSSALIPANSGGGRPDAAAAGICGGNRDGPFATTRKDADAFVRSPHSFPGFDPMAPEASRRRCREASSVSAVELKNAIQTPPSHPRRALVAHAAAGRIAVAATTGAGGWPFVPASSSAPSPRAWGRDRASREHDSCE